MSQATTQDQRVIAVAAASLSLERIVSGGLNEVAQKLSELTKHRIELSLQRPQLTNSERFDRLCGAGGVVLFSGSLNGEYEGGVHFVTPLRSAIPLAGFLAKQEDEAIDAKRSDEQWTPAEEATIRPAAECIFTTLNDALKTSVPDEVGCSFEGLSSHASAAELGDEELGSDAFFAYPIFVTVDPFGPLTAFLLLPHVACDKLNDKPLAFGDDEDYEEDFEPAPITGTLCAYVSDVKALRKIRTSCLRVGLKLERRPKAEVPNPAVYSDQYVLIEIPPDQDRRFDWCRRLKEACPDVHVLVLLSRPTKLRVAKAYKANADAILPSPPSERALSQRLSLIMNPAEEEAAS